MKRIVPCIVLLAGCGARPDLRAPLPFTSEATAGGAYVAGCAEGARLVAARPYGLERWELPADGDPRLTARISLGRPGEDAPVAALSCQGERVVATLADGGAVGVEGAEVRWRGAAPAGWPAPATATPPDGPHRWHATLPDGREAVLGDWGRGTQRDGQFVEWRPAAGGLAEAVFDGHTVWAVGPSGLWRWKPGPGEPVPVPLPEGLAGRPLVDVFRDGAFLWVRTADGEGWPLDVSGMVAVPAGEHGPLVPPAAGPLRAPAGAVYVEATPETDHLQILDDDGPVGTFATAGPVHALLPLDDGTLLVAAGDEVDALRFDGREPVVVARLRFWSPTRRLFADADRVLLVGPTYGFAAVRFRRSN